MYPSIFNSFPVIRTAIAKTSRFHVPQPTFLFPLETPLRLSPNMFHGWKDNSMLAKPLGKTRMARLPHGEKFRRYLYSFWRNSRTWQTDRQTDRNRVTAIAALCIASHGKNDDRLWFACDAWCYTNLFWLIDWLIITTTTITKTATTTPSSSSSSPPPPLLLLLLVPGSNL